jgi:hypothetical protein
MTYLGHVGRWTANGMRLPDNARVAMVGIATVLPALPRAAGLDSIEIVYVEVRATSSTVAEGITRRRDQEDAHEESHTGRTTQTACLAVGGEGSLLASSM